MKTAFTAGYLNKEAKPKYDTPDNPWKQIPSTTAYEDAGRVRALQDAVGGDSNFNVQHPIISDTVAGTGGAFAGGAAGGAAGLGIASLLGGGSQDKEMGFGIGAMGGSVLGIVAALALTRSSRYKQGLQLSDKVNKTKLDRGKIKDLLRDYAGDNKFFSAIKGSIVPTGWEAKGYTSQLRNLLSNKPVRANTPAHIVGNIPYGAWLASPYQSVDAVDEARAALSNASKNVTTTPAY